MKLSKISCNLFGHSWSYWQHVSSESCNQHNICKRCGEEDLRIKHIWSSWEYISDDSCNQRRICKRCAFEETRVEEHIWSGLEYIRDDSCIKHRVCKRCGKESSGYINHLWSEWSSWEKDVGFIQYHRECLHCGESESYHECSHGGSTHHQVCTVCGDQLDPLMNC